MDLNTYAGYRTVHQQQAEFARDVELRRRAKERGAVAPAAAVRRQPAPWAERQHTRLAQWAHDTLTRAHVIRVLPH